MHGDILIDTVANLQSWELKKGKFDHENDQEKSKVFKIVSVICRFDQIEYI